MGMIRADKDTIALLRQLAEQDMRPLSKEAAWIIRKEWDRRFSSKNIAKQDDSKHIVLSSIEDESK